eukprot:SAG31_NODE_682_length_12841_cov_13.637655_12_plen_55_part_00
MASLEELATQMDKLLQVVDAKNAELESRKAECEKLKQEINDTRRRMASSTGAPN